MKPFNPFQKNQVSAATAAENAKKQPILNAINKCLVVIFTKNVTAEVATPDYMNKLLGISTESIKQVKIFPTKNPNITAAFIEMIDAQIATDVYEQSKNMNAEKDVSILPASQFLCKVAGKKYELVFFKNPVTAFYSLYKPNPKLALMFQQSGTMSGEPQSARRDSSNKRNQMNTDAQPSYSSTDDDDIIVLD